MPKWLLSVCSKGSEVIHGRAKRNNVENGLKFKKKKELEKGLDPTAVFIVSLSTRVSTHQHPKMMESILRCAKCSFVTQKWSLWRTREQNRPEWKTAHFKADSCQLGLLEDFVTARDPIYVIDRAMKRLGIWLHPVLIHILTYPLDVIGRLLRHIDFFTPKEISFENSFSKNVDKINQSYWA